MLPVISWFISHLCYMSLKCYFVMIGGIECFIHSQQCKHRLNVLYHHPQGLFAMLQISFWEQNQTTSTARVAFSTGSVWKRADPLQQYVKMDL